MKRTKLKQSKTLTSNHITTQITTVLLNNFVKYTCKIIYGHDKRKRYELGKYLYFFPINIPKTKCVASEDCTTV